MTATRAKTEASAHPPEGRRRLGWASLRRRLIQTGRALVSRVAADFRRPGSAAALSLMVVSLVCLICRYLDSTFKPVILAALLVPYATPLAIVAAIAFGVRRLWPELAVAGGVAIALVVPQVPVALASPAPAPAAETLRMLDVNTALGHADAHQIVDLVRKDRIDVLTLQEVSVAGAADLTKAGLDAELPFSYVRVGDDGRGSAIFSRYKMIQQHTFGGFASRQISAAIGMKSGAAVKVYSFHVWSLWKDSAEWRREAGVLSRALKRQPGCVVAAGDYDGTVNNAPLRAFMARGHVKDAASHTGSLFSPTYKANSWFPAIAAIDHAMYRGVRAVNTTTHSIKGSDHMALLATFDTSRCH